MAARIQALLFLVSGSITIKNLIPTETFFLVSTNVIQINFTNTTNFSIRSWSYQGNVASSVRYVGFCCETCLHIIRDNHKNISLGLNH